MSVAELHAEIDRLRAERADESALVVKLDGVLTRVCHECVLYKQANVHGSARKYIDIIDRLARRVAELEETENCLRGQLDLYGKMLREERACEGES